MKGAGKPKRQRDVIPDSWKTAGWQFARQFLNTVREAMFSTGRGYRRGSMRRDAADVRKGDRRADKLPYAEAGISQDMRRYLRRYS